MLAFQSENMLILTGGRSPQMHTNVPMQLPAEFNSNELDILNMSPIMSHKSNQSKILCRDWRPLQPLNRPLGRFNAAGCVLGMVFKKIYFYINFNLRIHAHYDSRRR